MYKVAITGGIGTGKSTVASIIAKQGYTVIDTDQISHQLFNTPEVQNFFLKTFNTLDRKQIRNMVFNDEFKKRTLEGFLHPLIFKNLEHQLDQTKNPKLGCVFVVIPLLFETKSQSKFDFVLSVICNLDKQLKRIVHRDAMDINLARKLIASQVDNEFKIKHSNALIHNNTTINELETQTKNFLISLQSKINEQLD